jgi:LysR family nod box-dependent transcriptional activator
VQVGRQLRLTPLAETLAEPVSDVLQRVQATISAKAQFAPATSDRRFSIMASDYAFTVIMPRLLPRMEREAPGVSFQLRQLSPTWQEELSRGDIDFLVIPDHFRMQAHPSAPIFKDGFSCVAWTGNSTIGDTLSFEEYLSVGHVGITLSGVHEMSFDEWFLRQGGHVRRVEVIAPTFTLVPYLVVGTSRLATIWTRLAREAAQRLPLKLLPVPVEIPTFQEVLQWPAHRDSEPGIVWVRSVLQSVAEEIEAEGV